MRSKLELLKQLAFSLADQVVVSACTFLTMVLISNHCTKADVGVFALTVTIVNLIRTVQERTIAAPYLAFAFREGFDRPTFKGSSFVHQAILGALSTAVIVLVTLIGYLIGNSRSWTVVLASLAMVVPLTLLRDQIRSMAAASFQLSQQLMFDTAVGATQLLGIMFLGWANRLSIAWVNVVLGLACVLPTLMWFSVHGKRIEVDSSCVVRDWNNNWQYSRWLVGARIFGIFGYFVVPWLVWYFMDEAATGAFAVCNSLVGVSLMCVTGLNNLFQPRTIRELQHSGIRGMIVSMLESIAVVIGILSVISIGFYFFGGMALDRIFGNAYAEYGHVAFILSLSTLAVSLAILFGNGLAALGNSKEYFLGEFSCCVVSVTAALVSIPWYGLDGAAASLALGGLSASLVTGWTLYRAIVRFRPEVAVRSTTVEDTKLEHATTSSSSASSPAITN